MPQNVGYLRLPPARGVSDEVLEKIETCLFDVMCDRKLLKEKVEGLLVHDWIKPLRSSPKPPHMLLRIAFTLKEDGKYVNWDKGNDLVFLQDLANEAAQKIADLLSGFETYGVVVGVWFEGLAGARYSESKPS